MSLSDAEETALAKKAAAASRKKRNAKGEQLVPYSNVTPEGFREMIFHLLRNDDEGKQAILDLADSQ